MAIKILIAFRHTLVEPRRSSKVCKDKEERSSKSNKSSGESLFNTRESGDGNFNLISTTRDKEDEVQEVCRSRPIDRDQAKRKAKAETSSAVQQMPLIQAQVEQSRIDKCKTNRNRVTNKEPELFGDDALPRPADLHRIAKSQRSSNSTASSDSNPTMFQEIIQQQYELDRKEKTKRIDREVNSRVDLNNSKKVAEDLKVLQISTDEMDPIDVAIINA
nr:hypothetical protein [Tanacetum cinerariifolium]